MSNYKSTKIIATIGPASNHENILLSMVKKGVNAFRLNFSHGDFSQHLNSIEINNAFINIGKKSFFRIIGSSLFDTLHKRNSGTKANLRHAKGSMVLELSKGLNFSAQTRPMKSKRLNIRNKNGINKSL